MCLHSVSGHQLDSLHAHSGRFARYHPRSSSNLDVWLVRYQVGLQPLSRQLRLARVYACVCLRIASQTTPLIEEVNKHWRDIVKWIKICTIYQTIIVAILIMVSLQLCCVFANS